MSALTEAHVNLRRNDRRTVRKEVGPQVGWTRIRGYFWAFLNSSLGLWFLSSVLLSTAVYVYQIWQDGRQQKVMTVQKMEKLNLEIAGRVSQFGTWARANLVDEHDGRYNFQGDVNKKGIVTAIEDFAAAPQSGGDAHRLYIHEIFPEFRKRNLISLYAELNLVARKALEQSCDCNMDESQSSDNVASEIRSAGMFSGITNRVFYKVDDNRIHELNVKTAQYREAEVALLSPSYLLQYHKHPNHDTFVRSFEGIFMTDDTKRSHLPSTDCLENFPNGGGCISYPEPSQPDDSQSADASRVRLAEAG